MNKRLKIIAKTMIGVYNSVNMTRRAKHHKALVGTYGQLNYIRSYSNRKFIALKQYNDQMNKQLIKTCKPIKVGFILYTSSIWNVDELYHMLQQDPNFDADLVLTHIKMSDSSSSEDMFRKTYEYFSERRYSIKKASETDASQYDILFYQMIGHVTEANFNIHNIPLNTIILYTSYSYMLADIADKLNAGLYHLSFFYYTDSIYYNRLVERVNCYTGNAKYIGFPKMDKYYQSANDRRSDKKIIIYAPHHSVHRTVELKSATFADNYKEILALAKKHHESTYWIYKPHPSLRGTSVVAGIFKSGTEYDEYEEQWRRLGNAEVVSQGDYFPLFKESDAMITDSVSFLAEYQFTNKPLLLLESGKIKYNDFGKSIVEILYRCPGSDITGIESFIQDVIDGRDVMKEKRIDFFEKNLAYMQNGISANQRIYQDILELTGTWK